MRILIVHNFYRVPGGEDAVVREECELLRARGHDVHLYAVHNDDLRGLLPVVGTALLTPYNPISRRRLTRCIAALRPDLVHIHNVFPQLSPSILDACVKTKTPHVVTLHNFRILCPTALLHPDPDCRVRSLTSSCWWTVARRTYHYSFLGTLSLAVMVELHKRLRTWSRKPGALIVLSQHARQTFIEAGIAEALLHVKGNAAPCVAAQTTLERHGALYVGRLSPEKGISTLLSAWRRIDYPLTIIGSGPLEPEVRGEANPHIRFLGPRARPEVIEAMRAAAFLVVPSAWSEMFPMTIAEAYAAGLPVIASSIPSLREHVRPGETGLIFEAENSDSLAEAVAWAIRRPEEMSRYGTNALQAHAANLTPEKNYERLMQIYRHVISAESCEAKTPDGEAGFERSISRGRMAQGGRAAC